MQNGREGGVRHLRKRICALAAALWLTLALLAGTVSAQGDTEGSVEFTIQSTVVSESAVSLTERRYQKFRALGRGKEDA